MDNFEVMAECFPILLHFSQVAYNKKPFKRLAMRLEGSSYE